MITKVSEALATLISVTSNPLLNSFAVGRTVCVVCQDAVERGERRHGGDTCTHSHSGAGWLAGTEILDPRQRWSVDGLNSSGQNPQAKPCSAHADRILLWEDRGSHRGADRERNPQSASDEIWLIHEFDVVQRRRPNYGRGWPLDAWSRLSGSFRGTNEGALLTGDTRMPLRRFENAPVVLRALGDGQSIGVLINAEG